MVITEATWSQSCNPNKWTPSQQAEFNGLVNRQKQFVNQLKAECNYQNRCPPNGRIPLNSGTTDLIKKFIKFSVTYEYSRFCPHRTFVAKHIAPIWKAGLKVADVAQDKEKERYKNGWIDTDTIHIFNNKIDIRYQVDPENLKCHFDQAVARYECNRETDIDPTKDKVNGKYLHLWTCKINAKVSKIGLHDSATGHYIATKDVNSVNHPPHLSSNFQRKRSATKSLPASSSIGSKLLKLLPASHLRIIELQYPNWHSFVKFDKLLFVNNTATFAGSKSENYLFADGSYLLNYQSWCDCNNNNSIATIIDYIEIPSDHLLPPPSSARHHCPPLQRCSVGISFDVVGRPLALFAVYDYSIPLMIQQFLLLPESKDILDSVENRTTIVIPRHLFAVRQADDPINRRTTFTYDKEKSHLIVKGGNISISDVIQNEYWTIAKTIDVFSISDIIIDANITRIGNTILLAFFAPNWLIKRPQNITLYGANGENIYTKPASDAIGPNNGQPVNGDDGKPGLPGGSAGHFFGAGVRFENANFLTVSAIGGQGGTGQAGGRGSPKVDGIDAFIKLTMLDEIDPLKKTEFKVDCETGTHKHISHWVWEWEEDNWYRNCTIIAKPFTPPGNGGNGGISGIGGNGGQIKLLGALSAAHRFSQPGEF